MSFLCWTRIGNGPESGSKKQKNCIQNCICIFLKCSFKIHIGPRPTKGPPTPYPGGKLAAILRIRQRIYLSIRDISIYLFANARNAPSLQLLLPTCIVLEAVLSYWKLLEAAAHPSIYLEAAYLHRFNSCHGKGERKKIARFYTKEREKDSLR